MDIEKIRSDFPILGREVYSRPLVYFDNGATTQKPRVVLDRILRVYEMENSNIHRGVHYLSAVATENHEKARARVAAFINAAEAAEVLFTRGTTESINLLARTLADQICRPGDEIMISAMEHHSNIVPWQMAAERTGAVLKVVPVTDSGEFMMEEYERMLSDRTRIVAVTHVSNVLGTVNPIKEIVCRAHSVGAKVLVDGAQAIAHMNVDVRDLDADFYAFSGHKIYAPNGIGVLWGRRELLDAMPPFMGGGEMIETVTFEKTTYNKLPYKYEAGTPDYVGSCALSAALDYVTEIGMDNIADYEHDLLRYATGQIEKIEGLRIIGNAPAKSGVLSFVVDGTHPYDIGMMLDKLGIAVRTGHHCAEPLMARYNIPGTVRASFAFYNTKDEINYFAASLNRVLQILR